MYFKFIYSNDFNGPVKKIGFHKFIHEKFKFKETSRTKEHPSITAFKQKMQVAAEGSREIRDALKNAVGVTIDAVKAFHILSNIPKEDYPLLCMSVESNNASNLILTTVPGMIFNIFEFF